MYYHFGMITQQLIDSIKNEQVKGNSAEFIRATLAKQGYSDEDITLAFASLSDVQTGTNHASYTVSPARSVKFLIIAIIILGVAGAASAYAYYSGYFVSPDVVTTEAFQAAREATSGAFDTTITIDTSGLKNSKPSTMQFLPIGASKKFSITTKGTYDMSDSLNSKFDVALSFDLGTLSAAANVRSVDGMFYATLTKVPTVSLVPMPIFSNYQNKWISFVSKGENSILERLPLMTTTGINPNTFSRLTEEQKDHIYDLTTDAHFVTVTQKLPSETVGGASSYHYMFDLDRAGVAAYFEKLKEYVQTIGKDDSVLSSFDPTLYNQSLESIQNFIGEAWIGKSDKLPHKVVLSFDILRKGHEDEGAVKIGMVSIFSDWNTPQSVPVPAGSMTLENFMAEMTGASLDQARQKAADAEIKSVLASMRAEAELFNMSNGDSYVNFCLAPKTGSMKVQIEEKNPDATFFCKDAVSSFAVSAKLIGEGYHCVDSTGFSGSSTVPATSTACPIDHANLPD